MVKFAILHRAKGNEKGLVVCPGDNFDLNRNHTDVTRRKSSLSISEIFRWDGNFRHSPFAERVGINSFSFYSNRL